MSFFTMLLLLPLLFSVVLGFGFTTSPSSPVSCDKLTVSWSGGTAPFTLTLVPVFGTPRTLTIPTDAVQNGQGSFSVEQLPFAADQEFLLSMSDATGSGAGGASTVFKAAGSDKSCDTKDPGVNFSYQLNSELQQCRPYTFSGFESASKPIQITGFIPGGQGFVLNPNGDANTFDWTANVKEGSSILFIMTDSQNRQGGSSKLLTVGGSGDQSCINGNSPSSTSGSPTATSTAASTPPSTSGGSKTGSPTTSSAPTSTTSVAAAAAAKSNKGAIAGGVVGALALVGAIGAIFFFYLKRRRDKQPWVHGVTPLSNPPFTNAMFPGYPPARSPNPFEESPKGNPFSDPPPRATPFPNNYPASPGSTDPLYSHQAPYTTPPQSSVHSSFNPYSTPPSSEHSAPSTMAFAAPSTITSPPPSALSPRRKGVPAYQDPPRFVLHTDVDDLAGPLTPVEERTREPAEELPPSYTDRRHSPDAGDRPVSAADSRLSSTSLAYMQDAYAQDTFLEDTLSPARR